MRIILVAMALVSSACTAPVPSRAEAPWIMWQWSTASGWALALGVGGFVSERPVVMQ